MLLGAGIALTIAPLLICFLNIFNLISAELNKSVTSEIYKGFLKSGLSVPYCNIASLKEIFLNG